MSQASTLCSAHSAVFRLHQQQSYKLVLLEAGALCKLAPQCWQLRANSSLGPPFLAVGESCLLFLEWDTWVLPQGWLPGWIWWKQESHNSGLWQVIPLSFSNVEMETLLRVLFSLLLLKQTFYIFCQKNKKETKQNTNYFCNKEIPVFTGEPTSVKESWPLLIDLNSWTWELISFNRHGKKKSKNVTKYTGKYWQEEILNC